MRQISRTTKASETIISETTCGKKVTITFDHILGQPADQIAASTSVPNDLNAEVPAIPVNPLPGINQTNETVTFINVTRFANGRISSSTNGKLKSADVVGITTEIEEELELIASEEGGQA